MKFKVKKVTDGDVVWIEVYLPATVKKRHGTYVMGFIDYDNSLVITHLFVAPTLRKKGIGRRLVKRIIQESGCKKTRVNNIQEGAIGFWEEMDLPEEVDARKYHRIDRKVDRYFREEGYA